MLSRWRKQSDQAAAAELFHRYADRLIALARSKMSPKLARRIDPGDVVQSAVRSFFVRVRDGKLVVQPDSELWHLLAAITVHKAYGQMEHHTAGKRAMKRETESAGDSVCIVPVEAVANDPTPDDVLAFHEELDKALEPLKPLHQQIVRLHLEGYTQKEIEEKVGRGDRMIRIVLAEFREQLRERLGSEEG